MQTEKTQRDGQKNAKTHAPNGRLVDEFDRDTARLLIRSMTPSIISLSERLHELYERRGA